MYKNIIFDLYGTLIDIDTDESKKEVWEKLSLLMAYNGASYQAAELEEEYKKTVEKYMNRVQGTKYPDIDVCDVFHRLYKNKNSKAKFKMAKQTAKTFRALSTSHIKVYDGVIKLLDQLKEQKVNIYILSNAQRIFLKAEMDMLGLSDYFNEIYISSDEHMCKPDVEFYKILMKKEGLKPKDTLMIGNDYSTDIKGANKLGIDSLYIQTAISNLKAKEEPAKYSILDGNHKKIIKLLS